MCNRLSNCRRVLSNIGTELCIFVTMCVSQPQNLKPNQITELRETFPSKLIRYVLQYVLMTKVDPNSNLKFNYTYFFNLT